MSDHTKGGTCRVYRGIDSAWGGKVPGGLASLHVDGRAVVLREAPERVDWAELMARARAWPRDGDCVVAIDQPLIVINAAGQRPVERAIARALMGPFGCGAHSANLGLVDRFGPAAGIWGLLRVLASEGFVYDPGGARAGNAGRLVFECYPHPALIGLFDLPRLLRYKAAKGDAAAWSTLLELLRGLASHPVLPLRDDCGFLRDPLAWTKRNEDRIDALVCAYTAAWVHRAQEARSAVLGDATTGAIVTPVSARLRAALDARVPPDLLDAIAPGAIPIPYPEPGSAPVRAAPVAAPPRPHPGRAFVEGTADDEGFREVELVATDHLMLWRGGKRRVVNAWFERFENVVLDVEFLEETGRPRVRFVPFARMGSTLRGMKPEDGPSKARWHALAAGCTKAAPRRFRVLYRYTER